MRPVVFSVICPVLRPLHLLQPRSGYSGLSTGFRPSIHLSPARSVHRLRALFFVLVYFFRCHHRSCRRLLSRRCRSRHYSVAPRTIRPLFSIYSSNVYMCLCGPTLVSRFRSFFWLSMYVVGLRLRQHLLLRLLRPFYVNELWFWFRLSPRCFL